MICVSLSLFAIGAVAVAKVAQAVLGRLGLDLMSVLLWLGLAERVVEPPPPRRGGHGGLAFDPGPPAPALAPPAAAHA